MSRPDFTPFVGERERHRARETGALILVIDTRTPPTWLPPQGGRWATYCADHGFARNHRTLARARGEASTPSEWCDECRDLLAARERAREGTQS